MQKEKLLVPAAILIAAWALWPGRFEVAAGPGYIYRLDRLTGDIRQCVPVVNEGSPNLYDDRAHHFNCEP